MRLCMQNRASMRFCGESVSYRKGRAFLTCPYYLFDQTAVKINHDAVEGVHLLRRDVPGDFGTRERADQ